MQGTSTTIGRHRAPRRPPRGPLVLVAAVAVLLAMFGVGAALLPPSVAGTPDPASGEDTTAAAGGAGGSVSPAESSPAPTTAPSPTATSAAPAASPTAPTPRQTPSRTPTRASIGGGTQAQQVLAIVNRERAANGCGAVTINDRLTTAARLHSEDQAAHDTMSHTGSDGSSPWERSERAGYDRAIGENVAAGYRTADAVMTGWLNSPGHRANILNCQARAMGLAAAAASDGTLYWTQMFGSVT